MTECPYCEYGIIWQGDESKACPHCLVERLREANDGWSGDAFAVGSITASAGADEIERLRGLLWYAWHEFNAIRARSGAPLDQYGMTLCTHEWWDQLTEAFQSAIGPNATTPWPSPEAKRALLPAQPQ